MATKTISIDLEAYERLSRRKRQAIKRLVQPPFDVREWFEKVDESPMSRAAARAVENAIASRSFHSRPTDESHSRDPS